METKAADLQASNRLRVGGAARQLHLMGSTGKPATGYVVNVARKQDVKRLRAGGKMMNDRMPCITDSDEHRFEPDGEESLLTITEQEIEWLCDDWQQAIADDTYETWRDVRQMVYGATQMLNQVGRHYETRAALGFLGQMAFENSIVCLRELKYEGAAA